MPIAELQLNIPDRRGLGTQAARDLSKVICEAVGKKIERMRCAVGFGIGLVHGDTEDPCAVLHIWAFDVFSPEKNIGYSSKITNYIASEYDIDPSRVCILFHAMTQDDIGVNGTTAREHWKC